MECTMECTILGERFLCYFVSRSQRVQRFSNFITSDHHHFFPRPVAVSFLSKLLLFHLYLLTFVSLLVKKEWLRLEVVKTRLILEHPPLKLS